MKASRMYQKIGKSDEKGFTLIEVLVAMGLFAAGIMAVISMQTATVRTNSLARNSTEATTIASDLLERLNSLPYNDNTYLAPGVYPTPAMNLLEGQQSLANGANLVPDTGTYRYQWTVVQDIMIPNTKTITITVWYRYGGFSWLLPWRDTREVQLVSVKPDTI
jgi:type IV pilus modification protein PilV